MAVQPANGAAPGNVVGGGPAGNQPWVITAPALDFTKYSGFAAAAAAVIGGLLPVVSQVAKLDLPAPLQYGFMAVAAVSVLSLAIVASTDVLARAYATAAQMSAPPAINTGQAVDSASASNGVLSTTAVRTSVRLHGRGDAPYQVLAYRSGAGVPDLLVGRAGEAPQWAASSEVDAATYQ
jgi:hypothetical protein